MLKMEKPYIENYKGFEKAFEIHSILFKAWENDFNSSEVPAEILIAQVLALLESYSITIVGKKYSIAEICTIYNNAKNG